TSRRPQRGETASSGSSGTAASATPSRGTGGASAAAGQGTLQIQTLPWARVFIDGRDTGRNTPVRELRVPSGSHRIGLRTADGRMTELTVQVPAGETVRIVRQL
ncbi:MAG: PEGA domain-containing protein, partial [Deltaproteobacteria bacterium]|nr:PEGA domain-containing protein [Deltaproteobacteria bacterium]